MTEPRSYQARRDLLKDRVVLVTGAGRGIGHAAALAFAAHGATVILHGRKVKQLESAYDEIVAAGYPQPAIFPLDLEKAEEQEFNGMAAGIAQQLGRLDGILHNAVSAFSPAALEHHSLKEWLSHLRINLAAPAAITRACLPLLKASPDASVMMTSDDHAGRTAGFWGGLAITKSGAELMVKILAEEWNSLPNLRVNAVVPGVVNSPQRLRTHPGELKDSLPRPQELMPAYLFLMGPDSRGISGKVIRCQE
jgi:NAD(P)-dependent dehydrogenase (short-subunit alcohol dehydrogenase family)